VDREHPWRDPYARAHLRNRKGYVYLTWRDGQRVRSFYLGKAPRKCPTAPATLIRNAVTALVDQDLWDERSAEVEQNKKLLGLVAEKWTAVVKNVQGPKK
jgi:hypothetical protein